MAGAATCVRQFTGYKRCFSRIQTEIAAQVGDVGIYFVWPILLTAVTLPLVEDKALDNTNLLGFLGKIEDPVITAGTVVGGT